MSELSNPQTSTELQADRPFAGVLMVRRKNTGVGRTGKPWLQMTLGDREGTVDARVWDRADEIAAQVAEGDVVQVEGVGVRYMQRLQLKVAKVARLDAAQTDLTKFLPSSRLSADVRAQRLRRFYNLFEDKRLADVYDAYVSDSAWFSRFLQAPAAKSVHHAYIGGLSEHTLSLMGLAAGVAEHYNTLYPGRVNPDLLLLGAFLHDTGKVDELTLEGGVQYSDEGRLVGHIALGLRRLDEILARVQTVPPELQMHLRHLLLSHHGELAYGSPTVPKTIEALLLHHIDNLDARFAIAAEALAGEQSEAASWTAFDAVSARAWRRSPVPETFDDGE